MRLSQIAVAFHSSFQRTRGTVILATPLHMPPKLSLMGFGIIDKGSRIHLVNIRNRQSLDELEFPTQPTYPFLLRSSQTESLLLGDKHKVVF